MFWVGGIESTSFMGRCGWTGLGGDIFWVDEVRCGSVGVITRFSITRFITIPQSVNYVRTVIYHRWTRYPIISHNPLSIYCPMHNIFPKSSSHLANLYYAVVAVKNHQLSGNLESISSQIKKENVDAACKLTRNYFENQSFARFEERKVKEIFAVNSKSSKT